MAGWIEVAGDVAQSIGSALYNHYESTLAYKRQRELRDEQWAHDAPAAQVQRFRDAGLNPNLAYGQLSNSAAAPSAPEPAQAPYIHSISQGIASAMMADAQRDEVDSRTKLNDAQVKYYESLLPVNQKKVENYDAQNAKIYRWILSQDVVDDLNRQNIEVGKAEVQNLMASAQNFLASKELAEAKKNFTDLQSYEQWIKNQYTEEMQQATIKEIQSRTNLNHQQAKRYAQVIEQEAQKFGYELAILSNQKDISDAEKQEAIARKTKAMYESAKYASVVKVDDTGKPIANGVAGGLYMTADLITDLVGRIFHFSGFKNFTPKETSSYKYERHLENGDVETSISHGYGGRSALPTN